MRELDEPKVHDGVAEVGGVNIHAGAEFDGRSLEGCDEGVDELALEQPGLASCYADASVARDWRLSLPTDRAQRAGATVRGLMCGVVSQSAQWLVSECPFHGAAGDAEGAFRTGAGIFSLVALLDAQRLRAWTA